MTPASAQKFAYRPDIDGLRAVSVLAVLMFHAGIPGFVGGFVGVDVFFVISGYLITEMMLAEFRSAGTISLAGFWARRFKRLAPALVFFLAVTLIASIFLLERISGETGALMRAALATVTINANHFFLIANGDYFGAAAETNPLLHMWSLAVEEQFYLVWPLLLLLLLKFCRQTRQMPLLLTAIIISFGVACLWTQTHPDLAFYLMPARAWEMLAGAALAVALGQQAEKADRAGKIPRFSWTLCGLLLIAISVLSQQARFGFPGPMALLPVLGAVLVIIGGRRGTQDAGYRLLSAPVMVYVGKLSYPLYLWHWSVLVFMRSRRLYEESLALDVLALLVAFALSVFTYEIIEKKTWRVIKLESSTQKWRMIATGMLSSCAIAVLALGIGAWARYGWGYSEEEARIAASRTDRATTRCMFGAGIPNANSIESCLASNKQGAVLLLGDSHANHWHSAISKAAEKHNIDLSEMTMNSCKPVGATSTISGCDAFNGFVMHQLPVWIAKYRIKAVVISASWPEGMGLTSPRISDAIKWPQGRFYFQHVKSSEQAQQVLRVALRESLHQFNALGLPVMVIAPTPVQKFAPAQCLSRLHEQLCYVDKKVMAEYAEPSIKSLRRVVSEFPNVQLIEPMEVMCLAGKCPVMLQNTIAYSDEYHLSRTFTLTQQAQFEPFMRRLSASNESVK
jgi:peptidoglycan/LPS O-acetylase OafA/YrhL